MKKQSIKRNIFSRRIDYMVVLCKKWDLEKFFTENTTILEQQNNKQKVEALHIRMKQPKLNRINFQFSTNLHSYP